MESTPNSGHALSNQLHLHNDPNFVSGLQDCAKQLVDKLQSDDYREASEIINAMVQARDHHIFNSVGKLTRGLHNAIINFHVDGDIGSEPAKIDNSDITDASDRLSYVMDVTQKAADKTMDMVEASAPIAKDLGEEANKLHSEWKRLRRRELTREEFAQLYSRMDEFLGKMCDGTEELNNNMQGIVLEQGFQDLTGQVLKRVIELVKDVEHELVSLVKVAGQVEEITGIVTPESKQKADDSLKGEGPQIHADKRDDVVQGQDEVDDLLSSLGF